MSERIEFYRATGEYGFLSNLYEHDLGWERQMVVYTPIMDNYVRFRSAEHAYQVAKARKREVAEYIFEAPTPALAAIVGHGLYPWMVADRWAEKRVERMEIVLKVKFSIPELRVKLLATGDAELVEDSKTDGFWGLGRVYKTEPFRRGQNRLGKMLMELRNEIRERKEYVENPSMWTTKCSECGGQMEYREASLTYYCECGNRLEV